MVLHGIAWYCMVLHGIAWYCIVLHGIAWYCMILHGIAWYGMVLHGIAWFCMVLHGIALYCMVLQPDQTSVLSGCAQKAFSSSQAQYLESQAFRIDSRDVTLVKDDNEGRFH